MEFDNSFDVPLPPAQAWTVLTDIHRVAACMPGAELTEAADPRNVKGRITVRLGPVPLTFAGNVEFADLDEANRIAQIKAQGGDAKGRGFANAAATFWIESAAGGSRVLIHTNLILSGVIAQYGRGVGVIEATATQMVTDFARNLAAQLAREAPPPVAASAAVTAAPPQVAEPMTELANTFRSAGRRVAALFAGRKT